MRQSVAILLVILAMFAFTNALQLKEQGIKAAHNQDRFSNSADWEGNRKGPNYRVNEEVWGHRCLSPLHCGGLRKCSYWGWCQDSSYNGQMMP
jgi:hypothetical protein